MSTSDQPQSIPRRVILSMQMGGPWFAMANVICVAIIAYAYLSIKHEPKTLEVKGSAKKTITSDTIAWHATIATRDPDLAKAYDKIKADADRVTDFIRKAGIPDNQVIVDAVYTNKVFQREVIPPQPVEGQEKPKGPTILQTNRVEYYELSQSIHIESRDMEKVPGVARNVTSLMKDGVEITSSSPWYLYSKLSELKIDMLGEATKDATTRASQIVTNANGSLGKLVEARMGVMQINPKGVTAVSDTGNNDVTSMEKDVLAVVTVRFELQ